MSWSVFRDTRSSATDTFGESRVAETLPQNVLDKMHAPPKASDVPVIEDPAILEQYDGWLLGIPTRYGNFPAQWKVRELESVRAVHGPTPNVPYPGADLTGGPDRTRRAVC